MLILSVFSRLLSKNLWEDVEMTINIRFLTSFLWLRPKNLFGMTELLFINYPSIRFMRMMRL